MDSDIGSERAAWMRPLQSSAQPPAGGHRRAPRERQDNASRAPRPPARRRKCVWIRLSSNQLDPIGSGPKKPPRGCRPAARHSHRRRRAARALVVVAPASPNPPGRHHRHHQPPAGAIADDLRVHDRSRSAEGVGRGAGAGAGRRRRSRGDLPPARRQHPAVLQGAVRSVGGARIRLLKRDGRGARHAASFCGEPAKGGLERGAICCIVRQWTLRRR